MANQDNTNKRGKFAKAVLASSAALIIVAFIAPASMIRGAMKTEMELTRAIAGTAVASDIYHTANTMSKHMIDRERWRQVIRGIKPPLMNHSRLHRLLDDRVDAAAALIEVGCYRVAGFWAWFALAIPLLIATIVDGAMVRKVRQHQFRYASHTSHTISGGMIGGFIALMIGGVLAPVPLPYIATAVLALPLGLMIWKWIGDLPKRL